jgi:hypothetical protein
MISIGRVAMMPTNVPRAIPRPSPKFVNARAMPPANNHMTAAVQRQIFSISFAE